MFVTRIRVVTVDEVAVSDGQISNRIAVVIMNLKFKNSKSCTCWKQSVKLKLKSSNISSEQDVMHAIIALQCEARRLYSLYYMVLFHRRTRTSYLYNWCLAWYNVLITSRVHSSVKSQFPKVRQTKYTAADSFDGGISVLNHYLSWSKFINTQLSHSRQWFNVHVYNAFRQMFNIALVPMYFYCSIDS